MLSGLIRAGARMSVPFHAPGVHHEGKRASRSAARTSTIVRSVFKSGSMSLHDRLCYQCPQNAECRARPRTAPLSRNALAVEKLHGWHGGVLSSVLGEHWAGQSGGNTGRKPFAGESRSKLTRTRPHARPGPRSLIAEGSHAAGCHMPHSHTGSRAHVLRPGLAVGPSGQMGPGAPGFSMTGG